MSSAYMIVDKMICRGDNKAKDGSRRPAGGASSKQQMLVERLDRHHVIEQRHGSVSQCSDDLRRGEAMRLV